jgi:TPR repeat protein
MGSQVERYLVAGDLQGFYTEIRRLDALGSTPARALLGYLFLRGAFKGGPRPDLAERHSIDGAKQGDPFSQYVLAWAYFDTNRRGDATKWMAKAALSGRFPPAIVDAGVWMAAGNGFKTPDAGAALKTLWLAVRKGHCFAIHYIAQMFLRGRFGFLGRIVACLALPFLLAWGALAALLWPLSDRTFLHNPKPRGPLFREAIKANPSDV